MFSHGLLLAGVVVILFPLYVALVAASLDSHQVFQVPLRLLPGGHLWDNLHQVWSQGVSGQSVPFSSLLLNSLIMALGITVGKITVSLLSAFAIIYFRFPLRNLAFWLIFMTLMLPVEVQTFPTVDVIAHVHMLDSYTRLTLPLSKTNLAVLFVITFIYGWNQYLWLLLIINDASLGTAVAGIQSMIASGDGTTQWNQVMAAMLLTLIAPVTIVLVMQRAFVRGLVDSEK
ncbi:glycerol-3-phosphate transporter membrane protein [Sodalis glossinidius]|nr:glycerol-3-phosphate transporter membrane protein [Sodalis glossinidius]